MKISHIVISVFFFGRPSFQHRQRHRLVIQKPKSFFIHMTVKMLLFLEEYGAIDGDNIPTKKNHTKTMAGADIEQFLRPTKGFGKHRGRGRGRGEGASGVSAQSARVQNFNKHTKGEGLQNAASPKPVAKKQAKAKAKASASASATKAKANLSKKID